MKTARKGKKLKGLIEKADSGATLSKKERRALYRTNNKEKQLFQPAVTCALCGLRIPPGQLQKHKQNVHGEDAPRIQRRRHPRLDVKPRFVSGGSPSLGRRN